MKARFRKPWQNAIIHFSEAVLAYGFYGLFRILPLDAASALGGWLAQTVGMRLGACKKAVRNLNLVYPDKTPQEKRAIVRAMWNNMGRTIAESAHLSRIYRAKNTSRVELIGLEHIDRNGGGLFFSAHTANWELMVHVANCNNIPTSAVYRPPNNPHVDKLIRNIRKNTTTALIPKGTDGARQIIRELKENHWVGLLVDQKMNEGIEVPFLGKPAMTAPAIAHLAIRSKCPIVPCQLTRTKGAHFKMVFYPPLEIDYDTKDREAEVTRIITEINTMMTDWINENPGQWLWLHRRFTNEVYGR